MVSGQENVEIGYNDKFFYAKVNGKRAVRLVYKIEKNTLHLISTYTLKKYRGKGLASKVVRKAIEYALEREIKNLKVSCSFVREWLKKHPEYAEKFNITYLT